MTSEIQLVTKEEVYGMKDQGVLVGSCQRSHRIVSSDMPSIAHRPAIGKCPQWGSILLGTGGECLFEGCTKNSRPLTVVVPEKTVLAGVKV